MHRGCRIVGYGHECGYVKVMLMAMRYDEIDCKVRME